MQDALLGGFPHKELPEVNGDHAAERDHATAGLASSCDWPVIEWHPASIAGGTAFALNEKDAVHAATDERQATGLAPGAVVSRSPRRRLRR